ncbi:hypothetical protein OE88DRAFT_1639688, partial [Heliocybe sulcata]
RVRWHSPGSLDLFAPLLYTYMAAVMAGICSNYPLLERFSDTSFAYACCCFNLGMQVWAYIHTDHLNLPFAWCAITALGDFDPDYGGHLILWSLGLVVRFPPGSTIYIPSALVRHSNIPVRQHERRFSIVQWMPGALCRWHDFGFKPAKAFEAEHGKEAASEANRARWKSGVDLFPRLAYFRCKM